ncbi:MAG: hypothetical protein ACYDHM_04285 [Acidiferrobacterales bacterium]
MDTENTIPIGQRRNRVPIADTPVVEGIIGTIATGAIVASTNLSSATIVAGTPAGLSMSKFEL